MHPAWWPTTAIHPNRRKIPPYMSDTLGERLLAEKPDGKGPLGKPKRDWVDNNTMGLGEIEWGVARNGLIWLRIGTGGGLL
jgi:hypothetical protein